MLKMAAGSIKRAAPMGPVITVKYAHIAKSINQYLLGLKKLKIIPIIFKRLIVRRKRKV